MSLIGLNMKKIRKDKGLTQQQIADILKIERSVYTKFEIGTNEPGKEHIQNFCKYFNINENILMQNISIAIPDTSAFIKNPNILNILIEDFKKILIPQVVIDELNKLKDKNKTQNNAWLAMTNINNPDLKPYLIFKNTNYEGINDQKIIKLANDISKEFCATVYIIHDDIGFSLNYKHSILLKQYITNRSKIFNYNKLIELDSLYLNDWSGFYLSKDIELDSYLPDGQTLLIHCIRSKNKYKYKKMHFLLQNGANKDKTDCQKYFLTPLSHCVQYNDIKAFNILLNYKADYNKGSLNESNYNYIKCNNEGNTPLMIACWHGRKDFVERLCQFKDLSFNQQDSNGYTALIKCAIKKNYKLYNYLLKNEKVDPLIRDRNNKTAKGWLNDDK